MSIENLRCKYHSEIYQHIFLKPENRSNIADEHNQSSLVLAQGIVKRLECSVHQFQLSEQAADVTFENITRRFLEEAFLLLKHLQPGKWRLFVNVDTAYFEEYEYLSNLIKVINQHKALKIPLSDYLIKPDILIGRVLITEKESDQKDMILVGTGVSRPTKLRASKALFPSQILHAIISCNWTFHDQAHHTKTEGLNLIRNRKGYTPYVAVVTAEPYPNLLASLALGTNDIDCVYHVALPELEEAVKEYDNPAVTDMLETLVEGKRLRDISDLPFDLAA